MAVVGCVAGGVYCSSSPKQNAPDRTIKNLFGPISSGTCANLKAQTVAAAGRVAGGVQQRLKLKGNTLYKRTGLERAKSPNGPKSHTVRSYRSWQLRGNFYSRRKYALPPIKKIENSKIRKDKNRPEKKTYKKNTVRRLQAKYRQAVLEAHQKFRQIIDLLPGQGGSFSMPIALVESF